MDRSRAIINVNHETFNGLNNASIKGVKLSAIIKGMILLVGKEILDLRPLLIQRAQTERCNISAKIAQKAVIKVKVICSIKIKTFLIEYLRRLLQCGSSPISGK